MSWFTDSIREFFDRGDRLLLAFCLAASGYGLVLIYSATRYLETNRNMIVQVVAILLGVLVYVLMSSVDIELFTEKSWKWMLVFNLVVNVLVRTPLGVEAGGNRSWIHFPGFPVNIQPAELAKLTFVLLLAWQMNKLRERGISRPSSVFQIAGHTLLMFGIIAVTSGDFGMGLTYLFIFVVMAWTGGVKKRWFLLAAVVCVAGIVLIWPHVSDMYFMKRFTVVIDHILGNPDTIYEQTQDVGWQQTRSIMAIGSGGLTGMGYLQGIQTQSSYKQALPARETDEIFAVCGEEFGLVGCCLLLFMLALIILRCVWVARRACSPQSALIAMGYAGMLLAQVGVNVGMCLYLFPVVGLTLPFISYGGSSIVTMFAAMGIISGIKMRSLPSWLRDRNQL
ncbi:FtsW/RodA/SpoVE family cell cycle protein [Intestinimonas massiliensis (ex Afouda et al. 2020)]|uniref:FtsW/RodA/SpoVE family cell cycle protein n=1 Tax=Intestinimonas massiliensis (ex Afouda et al. 2020) TaxID=1673721 RepID=UPI0010316D18|nr:FtsW/RodA/SpoVE family cell cycle protein [Intestinimonas massiliensis (ex Afouda et al. 2020)]